MQPVLILKSYSETIKMLLKTDWWVLENFHRMKKMPVFGGHSLTTLKRREYWGFNKKSPRDEGLIVCKMSIFVHTRG